MNPLKNLPKPFFILAPMDDVTDTVFRQIVADLYYRPDVRAAHADAAQGASEARNEPYPEYGEASTGAGNTAMRRKPASADSSAVRQGKAVGGPDLFFTEFVNVDGLQSAGREKLLPKLKLTDKEQPIIAQIWGKTPENYYKTTLDLIKMGYAGVDINMGCPDKAVIKNGCCSALINNRDLAEQIITEVGRAAGESDNPDFPISVKTRIGFGEIDLSWHKFLLSLPVKLNMLSIHGRTVREMSKVPAHWDVIGQIRELRDALSPSTLIVGNGDVMSRTQGEELAKQHGLDGIMIGRGIFEDPFIFAMNSPWAYYSEEQKIELYRKHVQLFADTWQNNERRIHTLNKFCKVYISGFDGAKELREKLMSAGSTQELLDLLAHS